MTDTLRIRVKILGNFHVLRWMRQFPGNIPVWGRCEFLFDPDARDYDWFVIYNDFPGDHQEEELSCLPWQTLLVTSEPSSIKTYGEAFTDQFGYVLTSQEEWALPHPGRIFSAPCLQWFYGLTSDSPLSYDQMKDSPPLDKRRTISTVCSSKRQRHTLHRKRFRFTFALQERIPEMDIYGHGIRPMQDKAEALDDYKYHVAVENHIGLHHWTEKLSDVFLAAALPFYCGCPNAGDYFPEESFIPIDMDDVDQAHDTIRQAIHNHEYEKRLPRILEARRRVLEQHNLFAVLSREIESRVGVDDRLMPGKMILSRRLLRNRHPAVAIQDFYGKVRSKWIRVARSKNP